MILGVRSAARLAARLRAPARSRSLRADWVTIGPEAVAASSGWRGWPWGAAAPRWYVLVIPAALTIFSLGEVSDLLESPLWIPAGLVVAGIPIRLLAFSRWGRACDQRHLYYRAALQAGVVTAVIYSTGWGPMLALGYLIVAQEGIWASGSRAATPGIITSIAGLAIGEAAVALGLAPSAVEESVAHAIAALAGVGTFFGIYLMQEAASEREVALEAERSARDRLAALLEHVPDAVVVVDRSGRIRFVSRTADEIFGDRPRDLVGTRGLSRIHAADRARVQAFFARLVERPGATDVVEHRIYDAHGRHRWVQVTARNLFDLPDIDAIVAIVRDVGDRRRLEEDRVALERAREDFLAVAAHELRTPLTTLSGAAAFLSIHGTDSAEAQDALDLICRQGKRIEELLEKLLDLSALEAGGTSMRIASFDLSSVVDDISRSVHSPDGTSLDIELPPGLPVLADRLRVGQILTNLLTNAYVHGGPNVRIEAEACDEEIVIRVMDDGAGVLPHIVPRLFEPFTRGSTHDAPGAGLGLAICARLVEAQHGEISYAAAPTGACFTVRLPAASSSSSS